MYGCKVSTVQSRKFQTKFIVVGMEEYRCRKGRHTGNPRLSRQEIGLEGPERHIVGSTVKDVNKGSSSIEHQDDLPF